MTYELKHRTQREVGMGLYYPLGATLSEDGVNFAVYSQYAREVFLLLFPGEKEDPTDIIRLAGPTKYIWHAFVGGLRAGQLYGYKVRGEYNPGHGKRFNERKLLVDPYAKAVTGKFRNIDGLLFAYDRDAPGEDLVPDLRDNSHIVPKSIVIDESFDWQGDTRLDNRLEKMIIYEVHLKGFTAHGSSGVKYPGTYPGFIEKIPYLKDLGINAVEFLPLHEHYDEDFVVDKGLKNYWGYNTVGFFTPESSYSTMRYPGCQVDEFKTLVRELHKAGIEVILDVVYNHSGEGNEQGPTLCFRGIDNCTYYCLSGTAEEPYRRYLDYTGCGNSLNLANSHVIRFVMDSLRYWVEVMHVDGFRFDLASVLGKNQGMFEKTSSFFDAISQDPVLNRIKLIAEPWDLTSYQVGNFPVDWSEWNGRFRDVMRKFGKGDGGMVRDVSLCVVGSPDLYGEDGRSPFNSINFITCHDGFTLYDLASYNQKHNEANLEGNADGTDYNNSWNCGVEGSSDDPEIIRLRKQLIKNHICSIIFSHGTPMILSGDECMRTQRGNNNAYCQDNEISWFDWRNIKDSQEIVAFVKKVIAFEKANEALQKRKFRFGDDGNEMRSARIAWLGPDLQEPRWDDRELRIVCMHLSETHDKPEEGVNRLFAILNADHLGHVVLLPGLTNGMGWYKMIDTSHEAGDDFCEPGKEILINPPGKYIANPRSIVLLVGK